MKLLYCSNVFDFFGISMLKWKIKNSFLCGLGGWNQILVWIMIKFGSKSVRTLKIKSIELLVLSEPLGSIWSVNEIKDFRNHFNDLKDICYMNLVRVLIPAPKNQMYIKWFCVFLWFSKSFISLTDQIKPSGSDSTSSSIKLIFSALTYIEPNFMMIQTRIWFDHPCRHKNDFLIFRFNIKNP